MEKIEKVCRNNKNPGEECLRHLRVMAKNQLSHLEKEDKKVLAEFQIQTLIIKENIGDEKSDEGYDKEEVIREIASEGGAEDVDCRN